MNIQGERGEIDDLTIRYLTEENIPVTHVEIVRKRRNTDEEKVISYIFEFFNGIKYINTHNVLCSRR